MLFVSEVTDHAFGTAIGRRGVDQFPAVFHKKRQHFSDGCNWREPRTSKVTALPSPITGSFSPVDGIARSIRRDDSSAATRRDVPIGNNAPTAVAPINFAARRREIVLCIVTQLLVLRDPDKQEDFFYAFYFALGVLVNDRLPARSSPERAKA